MTYHEKVRIIMNANLMTKKIEMTKNEAKGARIGRPRATADTIPSVFYRHYPTFKSGQLNLSESARVCDLSRTTILNTFLFWSRMLANIYLLWYNLVKQTKIKGELECYSFMN